MANIKSWTSSNSGPIHQLIPELSALERWKKCCGHDSAFSFDRVLFKLAGYKDKHKISDEFDI